MFDSSLVFSRLNKLVGWKKPSNFNLSLSSDNEAATSSRYYTDNDMVKLNLIYACQPNTNISEQEFQALLTDLERRGINNVLDKVFEKQDFIDRQLLYKHPNNKVKTSSLPSDSFVGLQLEPKVYGNNYAFEIARVVLEFQNTGTLDLYLYNSAKKQPIKEEVGITVTSENQVIELGWLLNDLDGLYRGEYFLGYRTNDTTLVPYYRDYEAANIASIVDGMYIHPISSPIDASGNLFDLEDVDNVDKTWGINPDIVIYDDYTDFIIQSNRMFSVAVQKAVQLEVLKLYASTDRSNRDSRISDSMLKNILYNSQGLNKDLKEEIDRLKQEVKKLKLGLFSDNQIHSVTRS